MGAVLTDARWRVTRGTSSATCYAPDDDPGKAERDRQSLALRAASPMRPRKDQQGLAGLDLFEPPML